MIKINLGFLESMKRSSKNVLLDPSTKGVYFSVFAFRVSIKLVLFCAGFDGLLGGDFEVVFGLVLERFGGGECGRVYKKCIEDFKLLKARIISLVLKARETPQPPKIGKT